MPKLKAVLFDNDGTLVNTQELLLASFHHAVTTVLGRDYTDEELLRGVGTPLADQMRGFSDDPDVQQRLLVAYREHNHAVHDSMVELFPGVAEGLAYLQDAGLSLGVVTAKMHALAWHGLEVTGVSQHFGCLIGPDDCPLSKPHPEPIVEAAARLGLPAEECLYVGDSPYDMQAGNAAGCRTAAALWGMFDADVLRACNPTFECRTFAELVDLALRL